MKPDDKPQLHMIWPIGKTVAPEELNPPGGYSIRTYLPGDEEAFLRLAVEGEFDRFDQAKLQFNIAKIIPGGWFFATRMDRGAVCGTAMCLHNYTGKKPFMGDVGWVVCSPDDRGNGLGASLTARVTQRFLDAGYSHIQLHTEHYRLAAIKTYLKIGYIPVINSSAQQSLWREICERLYWESIPDQWKEAIEAQQRRRTPWTGTTS
jgi:mycothiol synthase